MYSRLNILSTLTVVIMLIAFGCDTVESPTADTNIISAEISEAESSTRVPGHNKEKYDKDGNGFPDAGVYVNGHYTSLYAYDDSGNWYWDLGDGRVQGSVNSVDELDEATLTTCKYIVNYRADFGNDPFMDAGSIHNNINCKGSDKGHYKTLIVHESDPRYTGNPDWAIWGTWEYHVDNESGIGNKLRFSRPESHVGS